MCIIVYVVKNVRFSSGLIWYIQLSSLFQFEVYDTIFASISVLRSRCRSCIGKPIYLVCWQLQLYRLFEFVNSSVPAAKHRHISCLIVNVLESPLQQVVAANYTFVHMYTVLLFFFCN